MSRLALFAAFVIAPLATAQAHPHVWVSARSDIVYDATGAVTAIKQRWTFDDVFAAFATQGLDVNKDGVYSREELQPLAQTNVDALHDFEYFTFVRIGGEKIPMMRPVDYWLDYTDNHLTLHFTLPFNGARSIGEKPLAIEIYDPTYFVAFDMAEGEPVTLASAPSGCALSVHRASEPDPALADKLKEDSFAMAQTGIGQQFSNRILVNCP